MAENKSCAFRTSIGGQALIEGILMRGPEKQAIVVRDQEGNLVEKVEELKLIKDRYPILGLPLVRGTVNFLAAMVNGVKALMYSAEFYPEEESMQPSKFELWLEKHLSSKALESAIIMLADTVEAAVRSMPDPTPESIRAFIAKLVAGKLDDGQMSNAPLTLKDITKISDAFATVLQGVFHERIEYPTISPNAAAHVAAQENAKVESAKEAEAPAEGGEKA